MIPHRAESVHLYALERFEVFQRAQVVPEIRFLLKHHLLVVPSLHCVIGGNSKPRLAQVSASLCQYLHLKIERCSIVVSLKNKSVPFFLFQSGAPAYRATTALLPRRGCTMAKPATISANADHTQPEYISPSRIELRKTPDKVTT